MGLGGDLLWTAIFQAVHEHEGKSPVACCMPELSDILAGRLYDGSVSLCDGPVFKGNPFVTFTDARPKSMANRAVDSLGAAVLAIPGCRRLYENWVFQHAERIWRKGGPRYIHIDMRRHSYAARQTRRRTYWKDGRALDAMAKPFGDYRIRAKPNLHFSEEENRETASLLAENHIDGKPFVAVEPDTNRDWFGELRAWPMYRWQVVVDRLKATRPDLPVVQIGLGRSGVLSGAVDLTGKTDFRSAARVIREAALFMGTEGGLMHAARAVDARALILWGGVTVPEFIGYPEHQTTICKYVACAPCGNAGWCDLGHRCMREITTDDVFEAAAEILDRLDSH